ncbi:MAG: YncE family protein [Nitrosotalea sp.]
MIFKSFGGKLHVPSISSMKSLHLSIVIVVGMGILVSLGLLVLLSPHTIAGNPRILSSSNTKPYFAGIAVNPITHKVYVCDYGEKQIHVLDAQTNQTLAYIQINGNPWDVAVNPVTNKVYVVNRDSYTAITVIDGSSDQVINSINLIDMGTQPPQMTFDAGRNPPTYYKIEPVQVAVNPITNKVYVNDWNFPDGGITVIDGKTDTVIDTILGLGGASYGIGINPNTNRIYVDNFQDVHGMPFDVTVIDGTTDKILTNVTIGISGITGVSTIPAALRVVPLAVNPSNNSIYATCWGCLDPDKHRRGDWISVINGTTNNVVDRIPISASGLAVDPNSNTLYAAMAVDPVGKIGSFDIAIIDGKNNKITGYLKSDNGVFNVAVNPSSGNVYVTGNFPKSSVSLFSFES